MKKVSTVDLNEINILINGQVKDYSLEQLRTYINEICSNSLIEMNIDHLLKSVYSKLKYINTQNEIDEQIINSASNMIALDEDYSRIAVAVLVRDLHKKTHDDYFIVCKELFNNINRKGNQCKIISGEFLEFVANNREQINAMFDYTRDYDGNIFSFRTLEKSYLKKLANGKIVERPQHMFMRVAIAVHFRNNDLAKIKETYEYMSKGYFTHATPTLYNAGSEREQMSSCFLMTTQDSIEGIGKSVSDCMNISKYAGGIGLAVTSIRAEGAYINSTQGKASGLRAIKLFNEAARYSSQSGKRPGSFAMYLEPWHADIYFFLDLKKNIGESNDRARDIFLGLWINDLFMKRVDADGNWSLMSPDECPGLDDVWGEEFDKLYESYEKQGKYIKVIKARELWNKILEAQIETGTPYVLYKDACNRKSNQQNLGTIKCSNLCAEIIEYSSPTEYAVCNLASICLPKFIVKNSETGELYIDYEHLFRVARILTRNLNNIIDINFYPLEECRRSNMKNRPIGIGVQGLADVFSIMGTAFDSELARDINKKIFETIYFGAMTESMELAKIHGPYESYPGSPISQGLFQFDMWNNVKLSGMWDWNNLRENIMQFGVRNSLTTACMPTASTAQIMRNNECIEPYTSNIYSRSTLAGTFYIVNNHLVGDLKILNLWDEAMCQLIQYYKGSIQKIKCIPQYIKERYRTVWEIPQKSLVQMSADRAPFIDQTQSLNIFMERPTYGKLGSSHFYAWRAGLKTGMYYLRTHAATDAVQFGTDISLIKKIQNIDEDEKDEEPIMQPIVSAPVCKWNPKRKLDEQCDVCSA